MPTVISKLEETNRSALIVQLKIILTSNGYIEVIVNWLCDNIHKICEDTLQFVDIINIQQKAHETFTTDILIELISMSQIVDIPEALLQTFIDIFCLLKGADQPFNKLLNWTHTIEQGYTIHKISLE